MSAVSLEVVDWTSRTFPALRTELDNLEKNNPQKQEPSSSLSKQPAPASLPLFFALLGLS